MPYKDKKKQYAAIARSWTRRKKKVILMLGGACKNCGYNKHVSALHLHHKDPSVKKYEWVHLRVKKWETIYTEIAKCELLCANCHAEVSYPDPLNFI